LHPNSGPVGITAEKEEFMVSCPKCDAPIDVEEEELDEGDVLSCDECGASLTVASVNPVELESEDQEDEDDEDYDYDEDEADEEEEDEEEEEESWH
jgi:alpha-aminoadipate/glutamate carrier protein LysW